MLVGLDLSVVVAVELLMFVVVLKTAAAAAAEKKQGRFAEQLRFVESVEFAARKDWQPAATLRFDS